jgi:hypothetical protein
MLAEKTIQLLTAYVDDELDFAERQAVLHVLHQSSEAREMLAQLRDNAEKIKQMPRRTLGEGFVAQVLRAIAQRTGQPGASRRPASVPLRWLPYAAAALAASVLFLATIAGVLYVTLGSDWLGNSNPSNDIARGEPVDPGPSKLPENPAPEPESPPPPRKPPNPMIHALIDGTHSYAAKQITAERSVSVTFQELSKAGAAANRFTAEIKKNAALQLDVTVRNNPEAVERLKSVLKQHGVKLVVDPATSATLKKGQGKPELLVYAENLQPEELTKILKQLAAEEKKTPSPFDRATLTAMSKQERQQITSLLGGTDPEKRDQGTTIGIIGPRPKAQPNSKVERVVVVLPQAPEAKTSEEVRQFLLQPARPQPGAVRLLIRIHQD